VEDYGGRKTKSREDEATASMAGESNSIYPSIPFLFDCCRQ